MTYDRKLFDEITKKQKAEKQQQARQPADINVQAPADLLTGTESWDRYVAEIHLMITAAKANQKAIYEELATKPDFSYEFLIRNKLQAMLLDERIDALEEVIRLPKSMLSV